MFESDAIALGAPTAGRMSGRARKAALDRLHHKLFDGVTWKQLPADTEKDRLLRQAAELREMASRGMHPRKYRKAAEELEAKAATL